MVIFLNQSMVLPELNVFKIKTLAVSLLAVLGVACAQVPNKPESAIAPSMTACSESRPEVCTMDYRPVCATRDTGIRCVTTPCPSTELKTYSNACGACSDAKVLGFIQGACATH